MIINLDSEEVLQIVVKSLENRLMASKDFIDSLYSIFRDVVIKEIRNDESSFKVRLTDIKNQLLFDGKNTLLDIFTSEIKKLSDLGKESIHLSYAHKIKNYNFGNMDPSKEWVEAEYKKQITSLIRESFQRKAAKLVYDSVKANESKLKELLYGEGVDGGLKSFQSELLEVVGREALSTANSLLNTSPDKLQYLLKCSIDETLEREK